MGLGKLFGREKRGGQEAPKAEAPKDAREGLSDQDLGKQRVQAAREAISGGLTSLRDKLGAGLGWVAQKAEVAAYGALTMDKKLGRDFDNTVSDARAVAGATARGAKAAGRGVKFGAEAVAGGAAFAGRKTVEGANFAASKTAEGARAVGGATARGAESLGRAAVRDWKNTVGDAEAVVGATKRGAEAVAGATRRGAGAVAEGATYAGGKAVEGARAVGGAAVRGAEATGRGVRAGAEFVGDRAVAAKEAVVSTAERGYNSLQQRGTEVANAALSRVADAKASFREWNNARKANNARKVLQDAGIDLSDLMAFVAEKKTQQAA